MQLVSYEFEYVYQCTMTFCGLRIPEDSYGWIESIWSKLVTLTLGGGLWTFLANLARRRSAAHAAAAAADWLRGNSKLEKTEFLPRQLVRVTWCCLIAALHCGVVPVAYTHWEKFRHYLSYSILVHCVCLIYDSGNRKLEKTEFMPHQFSGGGKWVEGQDRNRFSLYLSYFCIFRLAWNGCVPL